MVLEAAVNGRADALVTFNIRDFAGVAEQFGVAVLPPGEAVIPTVIGCDLSKSSLPGSTRQSIALIRLLDLRWMRGVKPAPDGSLIAKVGIRRLEEKT